MIAAALDPTRFRVTVATAQTPGSGLAWDDSPDVQVWRIDAGSDLPGSGFRHRARAVAGAARRLPLVTELAAKARQADVQIVHTSTDRRDLALGWALSAMTGAALVLHWHNYLDGEYPLSWRLAFRRADMIISVSDASAESLRARGVRAEKIRVALNGIDTARFRPDPRARGKLLEELHLPDRPLIAVIGRLSPVKGQGTLVRSVAELRRRGVDASLLVVGSDDRASTPGGRSYRRELEELVRQLGLAENVRLQPFRRDIDAVLAAIDVLAAPSISEPFGLVILEAMACKTAVVASRVGGIPEIVVDGVTGLLVPPEDTSQLASALERLLSDKALRKRFGAAGRHRAEETFDHHHMGQRVMACYEELLLSRSSVMRARP